jgi:hypothetical protein
MQVAYRYELVDDNGGLYQKLGSSVGSPLSHEETKDQRVGR